MPRKTRRRISETRRSRRIRRRGTRRSGTRIRGGNRRYHNGGNIITYIKNIRNNPREFLQEQKKNLSNVQQKLTDAIFNNTAKSGMTTPSPS